jgi:hypothetical protein
LKKGETLVFFYDLDFGQMAELVPDIFSGHTEPLFPELSAVAEESGYSLKLVPVDILKENYISAFQNKLPKHNRQVVITSFLYSVPEIKEQLAGYQTAVVGASMDVDLAALEIIGNGFRMIENEGRLLAAAGQKINFVSLKSGFQQQIFQAFKKGAGDIINVFEVEPDAVSVMMPISFNLVVVSYGKFFNNLSTSMIIKDKIRVLNYPGSPNYVDANIKKKVDAFICYDFVTSFKSAILELASGKGEKKSFYSFDLIRR